MSAWGVAARARRPSTVSTDMVAPFGRAGYGAGCRPTVGLHSHTDSRFVNGGSRSVDKRVQRGQATREQLVEVAIRLFAERGFDGTSIEAVLDAAGVSRGPLYHHF